MQLRREGRRRASSRSATEPSKGASGPKATGGSIRRASSGPMPTMCGATATTSAGTPRPTICCCIPYITADSIGGDLSTEEYAFGGGYARRLGRFAVALRGDYRAGQEYRQVDPRPHNVVSDFTLRFGGGIEWQRHTLLADFAWRLYKQNQRISFQNETNIVRELFMTGLGSYLPRYSGSPRARRSPTKAADTARRSSSCPAPVRVVRPAAWERFTADRNYRPNNSIPVSSLTTQELKADVVYRARTVERRRLRERRTAARYGDDRRPQRTGIHRRSADALRKPHARGRCRGYGRLAPRGRPLCAASVDRGSTSTARYLAPGVK